MSNYKSIEPASFPTDGRPSQPMQKGPLYIVLGVVVSLCVLCLVSVAIIAPHWKSPKQLLVFGAKGREPGLLYHPSYLSLDGYGNIYVADWGDGRINVFDPTGKFLRLIDVGASTNILGLAVAADGTVYVSYDGVIHRLDPKGNETVLAYTDANGNLIADISGIALGADGSLGAADNRGDVLRFGSDGAAKLLLASAYDLPSFSSRNELDPSMGTYDVPASSADKNISVAVDGSGNIYALGWISSEIIKTDAHGNSLSKFGQPVWFPGGWQKGRFDFPDAIVVDRYGRIYVGDNNGVQVFGADEKYLFSIGLSGGVNAMTLDPDGNLYVVTYPPQVIKLEAIKP